MINFAIDTFRSLRTRYIIRAYLIGIVLFAAITLMFSQAGSTQQGSPSFALYAYYLLCTILFPFAKFVWDEIRDVIAGDTVFFYSGYLLLFKYIMKSIVNIAIWGFAVFIAPVGIFYLWIVRRRNQSDH